MFGPIQVNPFQSIFIALLLLIVGFLSITLIKSPNRKYLAGLFFAAFFLRAIFVYVVYYYLISVGGDGFAFLDDYRYDAAGKLIAKALNAGKGGYELFSWQQNPGYFYFNGWLYSFLGADTLSVRMINGFLSSLTAVLVFEIARLLFNLRIAKIAGLLSAFMPSIVYFSVLQFKDTALIFVMVYTIYLLVAKTNQKVTVQAIFSVIVALFIMWFLRKDYTLPYIGIVLLWLILRYTGLEKWIERMHKQGLAIFAGGLLLILGAGVLIGLANTGAGHVFLERYDRITDDNKKFAKKASSTQIGFSRHLRINSILDVYKLPLSVGFTTILPLPAWGQITSAEYAGLALYSITNLFFILLLPFVFIGFFLIKDLGVANSIMLKWFPLVVLLGITIVFMGVLRYKEQLMPFFVIWAAISLSQRKKFKAILSTMYLFGTFGVILAVVIANMFK